MQITVSTITNSAIDLADMKYSQLIDQSDSPDSELIRYANLAFRDVYNQVVLAKEFYFTIYDDISVVMGTDAYDLPEDFYKLDGVDLSLDNSGRYLTLRPFQFLERNKFRSGLALTTAPYGQVFRYLLVKNQIKFLPLPSQNSTVRIWYTPNPTVITALSDVIDLPPVADEYMSLYMACAMLAKEESDTATLNGKRLEVLDQLRNSLRERDSGSAAFVVDESTVNAGALYPFRGFD